jgi:hypothetical protein
MSRSAYTCPRSVRRPLRQTLAMVLMLILALVAAACGGGGKNASPTPAPATTPSQSTTTPSSPATTAPAGICIPSGPSEPADSTPPPAKSRETVTVGLSPGDHFDANRPGAQQRIATQMGEAQSLGSAGIRLDIKWSDVQPDCESPYDWSAVKLLIDQATVHHQWVQAIFDSPPTWAISRDCRYRGEPWNCAVDHQYIGAFAAFVRTGVAMFGSQILAVEPLNEPNQLGGYFGAAGAKEYVDLVQAVFDAVRRINPTISIEPGGTGDVATTNPDEGTNPTEWYQQLKSGGITPFITRVNLHPYTYPSSTIDRVHNRGWLEINSVHALFPRLPLDITEIGWKTGQDKNASNSNTPPWVDNGLVTERAQAVLIHDMFVEFAFLRNHVPVDRVFVFSLRDSGDGTFGILHENGSPKPSAKVFKTAAQIFNG